MPPLTEQRQPSQAWQSRGGNARGEVLRGEFPLRPQRGNAAHRLHLVLYHRRRALRLNYAITHILYNSGKRLPRINVRKRGNLYAFSTYKIFGVLRNSDFGYKVGGSVYLITALYLSINLAIDNAGNSCYNESAANGLPFKWCQSFRAARSSILLTCWRHLYNIRLIPLFQGGFLIFPPLFQQSNPRNCHNRTCIPVFCDIYSPYPKTHTT